MNKTPLKRKIKVTFKRKSKIIKRTITKKKELISKKFNSSIKGKKVDLGKSVKSFFDWIKGAEIVELSECNTIEDPVRPELDNEFRTSYGRKIYGVKYKNDIYAVMCFAFTDSVPKSVEELDMMSRDAYLQSINRDFKVGKIAIAYTVWSKKKRWWKANSQRSI